MSPFNEVKYNELLKEIIIDNLKYYNSILFIILTFSIQIKGGDMKSHLLKPALLFITPSPLIFNSKNIIRIKIYMERTNI